MTLTSAEKPISPGSGIVMGLHFNAGCCPGFGLVGDQEMQALPEMGFQRKSKK
jgi:hypothetical protein